LAVLPHKTVGELGELRFCANALERGIVVNFPFGDNCTYDCVTEHDGFLRRVQIKSSSTIDNSRREYGEYYGFQISHGKKVPYALDDFDCLVAYIIPRDIVFIFPSEPLLSDVKSKLTVNLHEDSKWAQYRDAWQYLMRE